MNEQHHLTDFVIGSHLRRFHALQYLDNNKGGFASDIAQAIWRGSSDEQDSVEELERKMSFFLTDLEERGLIKTEMREVGDLSNWINWTAGIYCDTDGYFTVPSKVAGRYYTITERGKLLFGMMFVYVVYRKNAEEIAKEN